jgi:DNA-binding response OmpR family regulator
MAGSSLRILVIEDHLPLGRFITAALATAGCAVVGPVTDHASALDAARHLPLDLALMDRMLRGEETLAIADTLAERGIPCLWMSGYPRSTLPERFRESAFLEKPFTMDALLDAVRAVAGGSLPA